MSSVLTQLVGRATGAVVPGLRPRLPSLFEPGLRAAGFAEQAVEIPAGLSRRDDAPAPLPRPAAVPDLAKRPVPAVPAPKVARPGPEQPAADASPARAPHQGADPSSAPIQPPRHPSPASKAVDGAVPPAPPPLLPEIPPDRARATLIARLASDQPRPAGSAAPARTEPAPEPEITIHIGRLDIRSDLPAPAAPGAAAASRLPSLSDYLRGGRT